jgi:hypothetical protein
MKKNLLRVGAIVVCALSLSACALCHGHEGSDGGAMQGYWDHSNMRW